MMTSKIVATLRERPLFWLLGLFLPLAVQQWFYRCSPLVSALNYDTQVTYLPLARRFLENASELFSDPSHLLVAPGSFIYLALFGADESLVIQGNLVLSGILLLLVFDALRRIAGLTAATASAWLIALSPLFPQVLIPPLSEPPQLLCLGVWLWCCALICESPQRRWPVLLGGTALLLSILVRATYVYWTLAAVIACALLIWRGSQTLKSIARRLLVLHLIAAAGTAAYIVHNKATFDYPMIATGSGAALYFGINPAVAGYEPPYYGMLHDHFHVLHGTDSHLTIEGDKRLSRIARAELADMPLGVLANMLVQKAGATLFFSQAKLDRKVFNARAWHIMLVVLALFGLWGYRRAPYLWMLGCIAAYQVAIMTLAMHGTRYAIGSMELPLTLLAAFGISAIWQARPRARTLSAAVALVLLGIAAGYLHQRYSRPLMPDLTHVPHRTIAAAEPSHMQWQGMDGDPFSSEGARSTAKDAYIIWENLMFPLLGGMPIVQFQGQRFDQDCDEVGLDYLPPGGPPRSMRMFLNHMRPPQTISIGTLELDALEPLGGTLRIRISCPIGTQLQLEDLKIFTVTRGPHYLRQIEQAAKENAD